MAVRYRRRSERGFRAAVSRLLNELQYPTTLRGKIITASLAALVFGFLSLVVIGGFLLARALSPPHAGEALDPTELIGTTQAVSFKSPDGTSHNGWFFPGRRRGPVIVVLHGYGSSRSDVLDLATSLQEHRYNVLAFNLAGHGESPRKRTTLGFQETEELLAALDMLARRADLDGQRIGLWGHSLGAYTALKAAARSPGVKVLVLDSLYTRPVDMLRLQLRRHGAHWVPLLGAITRLEYRLYTFRNRRNNDAIPIEQLADIPKLFIAGDDQPALAEFTRVLFERAPEPKEFVRRRRTSLTTLAALERTAYEDLVISFFLTHLPLVERTR
ncbi:MAG: alpha/beta hydrolase [Terriglobia bacterium]